MPPSTLTDPMLEPLRGDGFAFVEASAMRSRLEQIGELPDWAMFVASWETLEPDAYLAQVGRHRRRRYAVYAAGPAGPIAREAHQPHYQSSDYNALQGNIERWFAPIAPGVGDSAPLKKILPFSRAFFVRLAPAPRRWHIEVPQFRIEAKPDEP